MSFRAILFCLLTVLPLQAQFANEDILPPRPPWSGKSKSLALAADDPWATHFERSGMTASPSYDDTMAWVYKLVAAAPQLNKIVVGKSLQGRDIVMIIASKEGAETPEQLAANGRPTLFAHAGIHSGEIDGKDAGFMLLRDMTVKGTRKSLLDGANWLFIPILNVDGHEWSSPHNRINQRGPEVMGWRTNGRNLNLNRDYAKLETRGTRAAVKVINTWKPDLYYDLHVTDGMDYQYDITYGFTGPHGYSPAIAEWLTNVLRKATDKALQDWEHIPGPLIFAAMRSNPKAGAAGFTPGPRFSNGYGDAVHLPTVLVENHSLKPYDRRVLGTYVLLEETLKILARDAAGLRAAVKKDRARRPEKVTLSWRTDRNNPDPIKFLGIAFETVESEISGTQYVKWLGKPETWDTFYYEPRIPDRTVTRPKGYWVPADWPEIIAKLKHHGVEMKTISRAETVDVTLYRIENPKLGRSGYEGRVLLRGEFNAEQHRWTYPKGSVYISTDQPLAELIVLLLEPESDDSFLRWGFFHEILQRTEYFEQYAVEPMAAAMLAKDPELKKAFQAKLEADEEFAKNPRARLNWFYERSPYMDKRWRLYPVGRVE
ncbi:MAG: M14 family metallopeptidase [Acidobacteriota bacterium]|nr:M14 family metallopeptidase [Acidobacteriota bacterium]